ncbi:hypothetical protein P280DRAFT_544865 [Massarina eburnea CBS 473.64]|uniref:Uncharacterized protein n=1 Tax=Massarina eburnea CBS 473.64 TaxID=1395130 RepID=A0A6A6SHQ0_9PLEO|nr:hypothetical protein P280DRAFT_544865 [Massarina eburnea CBS 473.64]
MPILPSSTVARTAEPIFASILTRRSLEFLSIQRIDGDVDPITKTKFPLATLLFVIGVALGVILVVTMVGVLIRACCRKKWMRKDNI